MKLGAKPSAGIITLNEKVGELEDLARSAGYEVLYEIVQRRGRPNPKTFVGKGKMMEIQEILSRCPVDVLLINGELKPSQHYSMENQLKVECVDRVRLVLNIFSDRASSRESQLQVQRAKLIYEIPLLREWIHSAKAGEHPGFLGGGEYETDAYYELIRRQLSHIERELKGMETNRELHRRNRQRKGFSTVAIAGYTNAGKSTLLNALTGSAVVAEDRLFSTLATTTGRMEGESKAVLLTDTIGFVEDLPHFLIESFKGTIDEIYLADLVLLVVDGSDPPDELVRKLNASREVLFPEVDPSSLIVTVNKTDLADDLAVKEAFVKDLVPSSMTLFISARSGEGMSKLREAISSALRYPVEMRFHLPLDDGAETFLSWLYGTTEVMEMKYGEGVEVHLFCRERDHARIVDRLVSLNGQPI